MHTGGAPVQHLPTGSRATAATRPSSTIDLTRDDDAAGTLAAHWQDEDAELQSLENELILQQERVKLQELAFAHEQRRMQLRHQHWKQQQQQQQQYVQYQQYEPQQWPPLQLWRRADLQVKFLQFARHPLTQNQPTSDPRAEPTGETNAQQRNAAANHTQPAQLYDNTTAAQWGRRTASVDDARERVDRLKGIVRRERASDLMPLPATVAQFPAMRDWQLEERRQRAAPPPSVAVKLEHSMRARAEPEPRKTTAPFGPQPPPPPPRATPSAQMGGVQATRTTPHDDAGSAAEQQLSDDIWSFDDYDM